MTQVFQSDDVRKPVARHASFPRRNAGETFFGLAVLQLPAWIMPENKILKAARDSARYQTNKESFKARAVAWRKAHPEAVRIIESKRHRTPEQIKAFNLAWKLKDPEWYRLVHKNKKFRRRALEKQCFRTATASDLREIKALAGGVCFYCKTTCSELTFDHVTPLSKGGAHSKENIVMACRSCNCSKGSRTQVWPSGRVLPCNHQP